MNELVISLYSIIQDCNKDNLNITIEESNEKEVVCVLLNGIEIITIIQQNDSLVMEACISIDKSLTFGNSMIYHNRKPDANFLKDFKSVLQNIVEKQEYIYKLVIHNLVEISRESANVFIREFNEDVKFKIELTSKGYLTFLILSKNLISLDEEALRLVNRICNSLDSKLYLDCRLISSQSGSIDEIRSF